MNYLKHKTLSVALLASSLLMGCASTDPYTPQHSKGFVYDDDMSFAMNVIDGSLGFHNGLRDARRPKDANTSPTSLDYAADGIIGAAFGGGLGGAFLSMLGTNQGNEPLNTYYGIVYYPINEGANIQTVFDAIEKELIATAEQKRDLKFIEKTFKDDYTRLSFKGQACIAQTQTMGFTPDETCNFIHYYSPKLLRYSDVTPNGDKGHFAVMGYERFFTGGALSLDLDEKYYVFTPVLRKRTKFPFVSNAQKIYPFLKPSLSGENTSLSIEQLIDIDPWMSRFYNGDNK
ncbi:hypothetical protein [Shewanella colwelliana]|uniref:hypothetical protein n=1 Tax=Shewanella colwelliana TaxID=23 RepID=UPI00048A5968|nr:hypothetical protein [Shewanella colwelliana]